MALIARRRDALGPAVPNGEATELLVNAAGELVVTTSAGGGGGPVDVTDRSARLLGHVTVDNATLAVTGPLTDAQLRASAVPVSGTFFQATQPVSLATNTPDVTDRAARLLGHVTVDNASIAITAASLPTHAVTQSGGPWTTDPTDRAARLLGHVTVDNASLAVTGTFWQATQPVSLTSVPAHQVQLRAATQMPTAVADAAAVVPMADKYGRVVDTRAPQDLWEQGRLTLTTNASTAILAAGAAGIKHAITGISATNTSATAVRLDILDGSTLIHSIQLPATTTAPMVTFDPPWVGTAATALNVQLASAVTDVRVVVIGYKVT